MTNKAVSLRPVGNEDQAFLLEVYASTRALEMAMSGWDQAQQAAFVELQFAAQKQYYSAAFPQGEHNILLLNGEPAGRIYTAESDDLIQIIDITLLPSRRNAGIGTPLIQEVLARGQAAAKPVQIYVENYNPSLRLFERLGFLKIQEDGLNFLLEWRPSPEVSPDAQPGSA